MKETDKRGSNEGPKNQAPSGSFKAKSRPSGDPKKIGGGQQGARQHVLKRLEKAKEGELDSAQIEGLGKKGEWGKAVRPEKVLHL